MAIQDILVELKISSGAFYHYFHSKPALLEALVEQMLKDAEQPLLSVVDDSHLPALEKLQRFFTTLDRLRAAQKTFVLTMLRVWYTDDNIMVRQKVEEATLKRRAPLLTEIVHQGIKEGAFTTSHPDQVGEIIVSLIQSMANTHAGLLLAFAEDHDEVRCVEAVVSTHSAYMDAIERVLGIPPDSLKRTDAEAVKFWLVEQEDDRTG